MAPRHWREQDFAIIVFDGRYEPSFALQVIDESIGIDGPPVRGLLLDLSTSESFRARSADGLRAIAQFLASRRERFSRRLAVVGSTDLSYGLLRMGMVYALDRGIDGEVFRDRDEGARLAEGRLIARSGSMRRSQRQPQFTRRRGGGGGAEDCPAGAVLRAPGFPRASA